MDTTEAVVKISQIKLLEYRGIEVVLNPTDKTPIHFYARSGEDLAMASICFQQGIFSRSDISNVDGAGVMSDRNKERFRVIIEEYLSELVRQWIDYFIYGKSIQSEKIQKNLE
ncbi:MAG: hypothetical protein RIT07_609 [Bacteroidota bacterium]|jgi:hypothetical protein